MLILIFILYIFFKKRILKLLLLIIGDIKIAKEIYVLWIYGILGLIFLRYIGILVFFDFLIIIKELIFELLLNPISEDIIINENIPLQGWEQLDSFYIKIYIRWFMALYVFLKAFYEDKNKDKYKE